MSAHPIRNRVLSATLLAALGLGLAAAPASALESTTTTPACNPPASDDAYVALGFLWGDGRPGAYEGDWSFRTSNAKVVTKVSTALSRLPHRRLVVNTVDGITTIVVKGLCLDVNLDGTPSLLSAATAAQRKEFLAGVITGEGSQTGLVLDDPEAARATTMRQQLNKVSIGTTMTGSTYFRVYADAEDWEKFQTFPFVCWGRVPGA